MVSWWTVMTLLIVGALGVAACAAVGKTCFVRNVDSISYRVAALWLVCFLVALVGALMVKDAFGVELAALCAVGVGICAVVMCPLAGRRWRSHAMANALAYVRLQQKAETSATSSADSSSDDWGTMPVAGCARLARKSDLTRREEDVLMLLMDGKTFTEVADELVVSLNTVKSHVRHIYAKMGVKGKLDLLEKVRE